MPQIGPLEILVVLVVALVVFGPNKLPQLGRQVGRGYREFRKFQQGFRDDIEGAFREPPLFAPPIDPALLAKAAAAGIDISSALADLDAPLPHYRFTTTLEKAKL